MKNINENKHTNPVTITTYILYANWKTAHSLSKRRHNSIMAHKYFDKSFLIKSWEAMKNFSFIAITKKKLCLIKVSGWPKRLLSPLAAWNRVNKTVKDT